MMNYYKIASALTITVSLSLTLLTGCEDNGTSRQTYQLRLAAAVSDSDVQAELLKQFKKYVEKHSEGKLEVRLFFSGSLGSDTEILQKTQMGVIQACNISTSNAGIAIKGFRVFDLPYIFNSPDDNQVLFYDETGRFGGPITQRLQEQASDKDLHILWVTPIIFRAAVMRKNIVKTPADFAGVKMRTSASSLERAIVSSFGANPVPMGASEVYTALQQGTIDGEGFPLTALLSFKHYEAAKKISDVNFQGFGTIVLLNNNFHKSLPTELQKIIEDAATTVIGQAGTLFQTAYENAIEKLKSLGCEYYELNPQEKDQFRAASQNIINAERENIGKDWISLVRDRIGKSRE